jgi:hypothetical protein
MQGPPRCHRYVLFSSVLSLALTFVGIEGCSSTGSSPGPATGGATGDGGRSGSGGSSASSVGSGGATSQGGIAAQGGSATGGVTASGGKIGSGGATAVSSGGVDAMGGRLAGAGGKGQPDAAAGGQAATGGTTGGAAGQGGVTSTGGSSSQAGTTGAGGTGGSATVPGGEGPCDIYQAANTPCVAAHSTVRALYAAYGGKLYQVRRASDKGLKDIPAVAPGGYADSSVQDTFCSGTTCTISIIYDQSPNANDLTKSPPGGWLKNGGLEADAAAAKIKLNGHTVYGVYTTMNWDDSVGAVGYRNNKTKGVPVGDEPESMYMVVDGKRYNEWCCFDYGNAETNNLDNGKATMECVYFGKSTQWSKGNGAGPWVMADLEDGVYHGGDPNAVTASNTSIVANYVTAMLKGPSGNRYGLKAGDAQTGKLAVKYDGPRPAGYSPQKKEGAIILGTGGDNSHTGQGTFFEGCMTKGNPPDATDDAIQANIVAAGYGQ